MEDDFDVQRDHVPLLMLAAGLLAPQGVIVFSNNYTRFRLDRNALGAFTVEDLTTATLPWDFRRSPRIHQCYLMTLADPAKIALPPEYARSLKACAPRPHLGTYERTRHPVRRIFVYEMGLSWIDCDSCVAAQLRLHYGPP